MFFLVYLLPDFFVRINTQQEQGCVSVFFIAVSPCQEQCLTHRMPAGNIYCLNVIKTNQSDKQNRRKSMTLPMRMTEQFF